MSSMPTRFSLLYRCERNTVRVSVHGCPLCGGGRVLDRKDLKHRCSRRQQQSRRDGWLPLVPATGADVQCCADMSVPSPYRTISAVFVDRRRTVVRRALSDMECDDDDGDGRRALSTPFTAAVIPGVAVGGGAAVVLVASVPLSPDELRMTQCLDVCAAFDNQVLKLDGIHRRFASTSAIVKAHRDAVRQYFLSLCREHRAPFEPSPSVQLRLDGKHIGLLFMALDHEYFGNVLSTVMRMNNCILHFRVTDERELTTQAAAFSRMGKHHYFSFSLPILQAAFTKGDTVNVCSIECRDFLDVLLVVLQHEVVHFLLATNNRRPLEPHGREFMAVAWLFFRHEDSCHQLPVPEHCRNSGAPPCCHRCVPTETPLSECIMSEEEATAAAAAASSCPVTSAGIDGIVFEQPSIFHPPPYSAAVVAPLQSSVDVEMSSPSEAMDVSVFFAP